MVLFKDLNKTSNDLLTRDFAHNNPWDVEFKHSAKNPAFTQNACIKNGNFEALSTAKYTCPSGQIEAKLGTTTAMLEGQYKVNSCPGLTIGSRFDRLFHPKGASDTAEVSVDYLAANGTHCWFAVRPFMPSWSACALACVPTNGNGTAYVGGEVTGAADVRKLKYAIGGSYAQSSKDLIYTASFRTFHVNGSPFGKLTSNIYAKANKPHASEYGVEVSHALAEAKTNVSFVGMWPLDQNPGPGPVKTFLKAKMSHDGQFISALTHRVNDFLTATIGTQIDASKGVATSDLIKYGVKLNVVA